MTDIRLSHIDLKDRRFSLSYPLHDATLRWSIATVGIIQPVILLDRTPYVPIAGWRRLDCARALGMKTVPALVVDMNERDALLVAIHDNLARGCNIIEKAAILDRMVSFGFPREDIFDLMENMNLNRHEKVLSGFLAIARLDMPARDFIFTKNVSFRNIDSLLRFEEKERKKIVSSLKGFHLTESTLREILEMLHLLKIRKGTITGRDMPALPNADALRTHLKERTHPILSRLHKKLKAIREAMALPPGVDIRVDPFFEKEYIDIIVKIGDEEEIVATFGRISELAAKGYVRSILELTKGRIR